MAREGLRDQRHRRRNDRGHRLTTVHRRHPPHIRRQLILDAARECILERGPDGATVREIASRAGVSVGTVTYHFSGMAEILVAVIRDASVAFTASLLSSLPRNASARDRLHALFAAPLADSDAISNQWRLWIDYWARAVRDPELASLHEERYAVWRDVVEALIREGVADGDFEGPDPKALAIELVALLDGLGLQLAIGDPVMTHRKARNTMRQAIEARLGPR